MNGLNLEVGEDAAISVCTCCNRESYNAHGFIYLDNDAYAIYYAGWTPTHHEKKITLAIAIGEWSDESTSEDRTCFGIEAYDAKTKIAFRLIDPIESPWGVTDLLGKMLPKNEAVAHPLLEKVFEVCELIAFKHPAIFNFLNFASPYPDTMR